MLHNLDNLRTTRSSTEHYTLQPGEADAFAQQYDATVRRIDGDDLSNELDAEVCEVLLPMLDRGDFERAGRVLAAVRSAYAHRLVARSYGDKPAPEHDSAHAAKVAAMMVGV